MSQYLAKKYGGLINAEGVRELFSKLERHLGDNRTKAAEECAITRKAIYDWENLRQDIKLENKIKVLETLIEKLPVDSLEYLTKLMHDNGSEALMSYLSVIYQQACDAGTEQEFLFSANQFENAIRNFAGLAYKKLDYEVTDMIANLVSHAKSQHFNWTPKQFHLYDSDSIKQMIPQIISSWIYLGMPQTLEELTERSKFPLEVVNIVSDTLKQFYTPVALHTMPTEGYEENGIEAGIYVYGNDKLMLSEMKNIATAGTIIASSRLRKSLK